ncbi:ADP-ribosylglycohydrolase family protein [Flavobacteriaceae bacterium TP-CH-4]|uniref:ADP-ribosylglycohydrolase family protein n=1 Tax=Pelagihabitans pacificus TaxID=2696054 RepID=A0A967E7K0_9FLAO|nr:ADP-ribosylglycohydrolase family protein [Pelagihabitans pacificus]NHF60720.1 ADP-ribosylglycohydrolase family protein [Pelagihabitans pacificus]
MRKVGLFTIMGVLLITGCKRPKSKVDIPSPKKVAYTGDSLRLSEEVYYDKVLGALVGSAIGDAMGASTEMWHRKDIQLKYGYITGLTPAVRVQSPEGTWDHNLVAGTTTDDTRWKYLMVKYFGEHKGELNARNFSGFISDHYQTVVKTLGDEEVLTDTEALDERIEKMEWIKEWARVAMGYQESQTAYQKALNRFYGGEMSCAGQLYTPMFGLLAHNPEEAYDIAYEHTLFDLGYAKDISALVAAMTHMALRTQDIDSILDPATFIDPLGYQDSRLVGRIPYSIADGSIKSVLAVKDLVLIDSLVAKDSLVYRIPTGFPGSRDEWVRQEMVNQLLEKDEKAIAFHAGEIWQILITSLQFGEGDFEKTMRFIVNYGRDNDTVAAIAGMILGAKEGYTKLPEDLKKEVLRVNREVLGIDLEVLAKELVAQSKM